MAKMFTFFAFCFVCVGILGSTMQGGGGITATNLSTDVTDVATTIPVDSVTGFAGASVAAEQRIIWIDEERILYTAVTTVPSPRFTGVTRGFGDSDAAVHLSGRRVFTSGASYVNKTMDYNISTITDASGIWAAVSTTLALLRMFGLFFKLNFGFLGTDMAFLTYIWAALGAGALVSFGLALAGGRRV